MSQSDLHLRVAATVLLTACAATTPSTSKAPPPEPDCSFRSATTCWTFASRFPPPRAAKPDSVPKELLEPQPAILATGPDSVRPSR